MSRLAALALLLCAAMVPRVAGAQHRHHHAEAPAEQADAGVAQDAAAAVIAAPAVAPTTTVVPTAVVPAPAVEAPTTARTTTEGLTTIPLGKGLPVVIRAGLFFVEVSSIDENEGNFTATVDLRLRWQDPRLRVPPESIAGEYVERRGPAAEARVAEIWTPELRLSNMIGDAAHQTRGLREYPDGSVEMMLRTTGQFSTAFDTERFPFDRQKLAVALTLERDNLDLVTLDYHQDDLDFSRVSPDVTLDGWTPGLVNLWRDPIGGWHGESHARVWFALDVDRESAKTAAAIFIPLFASLLIPLLAMWLNKWEDGGFKIEAFELANVIVGGLFAVIALNFTVMGEFKTVSGGDNTVTRLFGLNYLTLGLSLVVNLALFRFNLAERFFGKAVQEQLYYFLAWSIPLLASATSLAILLAALV